MLLQAANVVSLHGRARRNVPALGADGGAIGIEQAGFRTLGQEGVANRGVDLRQIDAEATLQALVKLAQDLAALVDGFGIAGDADLIAARHERNAKALLDAGEMAIMLAIEHG